MVVRGRCYVAWRSSNMAMAMMTVMGFSMSWWWRKIAGRRRIKGRGALFWSLLREGSGVLGIGEVQREHRYQCNAQGEEPHLVRRVKRGEWGARLLFGDRGLDVYIGKRFVFTSLLVSKALPSHFDDWYATGGNYEAGLVHHQTWTEMCGAGNHANDVA
ncbi:uncharacterized protein A4U43_C02F7610 [Asparagus officinalis]|uniref:Uncharacterized protein n=1 Tax=Asparagus officinalis TaxID=4686 RepID=A0A5P1FGQ5_ASPOF|nr:uncharacterized protein A4U43_C02F7610 [Asparagus officinalis]